MDGLGSSRFAAQLRLLHDLLLSSAMAMIALLSAKFGSR
jgi:hypothetical protein